MAVGTQANSEWRSFSLSALAHLVLLVALAMNFSLWPSQNNRPVRLAIDAAVVLDQTPERSRQEALQRAKEEDARRRQAEERERQQQREAELEKERVEADRRRQEQEATKAAEAKRQREAAQEAEAKRQAAEERKRAEEAATKEQARKLAEQREREAELARQKAAAEARRRAEQEAELLAQLAAEEERENAVAAGLLDQWREVIRQRVTRNWVRPASAAAGLQCEVRVNQIPGGEVVDVTVGRCNADAAVIRSIENAVLRASPLPPPPDPSLFERRIVFDFKPED